MQAITFFRIANSFPIHEEASFAAIAKASGLNESVTCRHAMTKNIFREPQKGLCISHSGLPTSGRGRPTPRLARRKHG